MTQAKARFVHRWITPFVAVPFLLILVTGIPLLLRRELPRISPPTVKGSKPGFSLNTDALVSELAARFPGDITSIKDIKELRVALNDGTTKVLLKKNYRELQVDSHTGAVLSDAVKWSSLLVAIHDGSFFSLFASYGVFFPASLLLFSLWASGLLLYFRGRRKARVFRTVAQAFAKRVP